MKIINLSIALLLIFATGTQAGVLVPNKTVQISLDGYCDILDLTIDQKTGLVTGTQTGCIAGNFFGTVGSTSKLGASITIGVDYGGTQFVFVIDDLPKKWTIYDIDGIVINSGTYSKGTPPPPFQDLPAAGE